MMRTIRQAAKAIAAGAVSALTLAVLPAAAGSAGPTLTPQPANGTSVAVCGGPVAPGQAACLALRRTDSAATSASPASPGNEPRQGASIGDEGAYDPSYLQSAYDTPSSTNGTGQTVAIVDAYDDPSAAADLASYRSFWGLSACTAAGGCFRKVNENGGTTYPQGNASWGTEISLDLDMVSAICPNCHILLVEASSTSIVDLGKAVNEAVALGANVVSNSYGGPEYSGETTDNAAYYNHPGVAITVSAGDDGYAREFPATSNTVTSVGGTSLVQVTNTGTRNATETVWNGTGSGCSTYEPKPAWQTDSGCPRRTDTDVSAVADPNTGVWVYDSYGQSGGDWGIYGGTSVAAPIIGAVYALADNGAGTGQMNSLPYADPGALNDVTSGSNGSCTPAYLCTGEVGYDGPTGLGTPNGVAAFTAGTAVTTVPGAPTNLLAAGATGAVNLTWSPPMNNGGTSILGYNLYRSTSSGAEALYENLGAVTSYSDTSVSNGTTYYYKVSAVNGVGEGQKSGEASAAPTTSGLPSAPQNLSVSTTSTKALQLSWSAPASNGGSKVTSYKVLRSTQSGKEAAYVTDSCKSSTCSYTDKGTVKGTTYYYEVAATNGTGTGPVSNEASAKAK